MLLVVVLSALFVLASAADESKENSIVSRLSSAITYESKRAAKELAAFWDDNQKTDPASVEEFLKVLDAEVFVKVKLDVAGLVRNSLGKAVTKPESTDMYNVLRNIIKQFTEELTLGRARVITKNEKMKETGTTQGGANQLSKSIADWYDGVANKNVTEEEKSQLIKQSQAQIDAFIKQSINADENPKSKVSARSGSFFYNQHLQQQQQKSSSSVAHKLTNYMTSNMCSPQQPTYINSCQPSACQPHCSNCQPGYGISNKYDNSIGHHSSYNHASSSNFGGVGSSSLIGSGHTSNGLTESNSGHHTSNSHASSSNFGGVGSSSLLGSGHSSNGLMEGMHAGHLSPYSHASGGVGSSSLIGSGLSQGSFGNYGSSHSFSGNNHNSHANSFDASMSGSSSSQMGHRGNQDLSGTYSGIANLWSPNKPNGQSGISGNSFGTSGFSSGGLMGNSLQGETSHSGGAAYSSGSSYNHHSGGASNMQSHGIGNVGSLTNMQGLGSDGGSYNSRHYSASNSKSSQSSKSDSSASHLSYGNNIW